MTELNGKTALVTGASSGIGAATVALLLSAGATVYAAARRVEKMEKLKKLGAYPVRMDLTDGQSMEREIGSILAEHGSIDILINNAGYGSYGAIEDVAIDEARRQFEVNIFGLARVTQLVLPGMRAKGYGKIVNISSMAGKIYTPYGGWYHATKHALEGLSDCLRLENRQFGIDVSIIEPGGIATEWGIIAAENLRGSASGGAHQAAANRAADRMTELYRSKRLTTPEKIAATIMKAVTARNPKTRYTTGFMARPAIFFRKLLPDRVFDRIIRTAMV